MEKEPKVLLGKESKDSVTERFGRVLPPAVEMQEEGYAMISKYMGKKVKVYLRNGVTLMGVLEERKHKYIRISLPDREATVNLDDLSSITPIT